MRATLLSAAAIVALALAGPARAAVVETTADQTLGAQPFAISFGGAATYAFTLATAAQTGNGPGAAVSTLGTAQVSSFFGDIADFSAGSTISGTGQIYGFSAFPPPPTVIPNSPSEDFIGLAFTLNDGVHYGYAEVDGPELVSYAYQSTPGAAIVTAEAVAVPEPASIALLVAGIGAIAVVRRREASTRSR